ncbi:MAG TPA: hypothetical protein VGA06_02495 [Candidatus Paceibacterota bacterium]|jgi:hypothetical protein
MAGLTRPVPRKGKAGQSPRSRFSFGVGMSLLPWIIIGILVIAAVKIFIT